MSWLLGLLTLAAVADALEGFWVGSSERDRVYVEWGGDVGADEATYQTKAGERVDLAGPVKTAPQEPSACSTVSASLDGSS